MGLLCIARALEGGESDIVSSHHVYNVLRKERPDVLKMLTEPTWYFDRKGEVSRGEDPYIRTSVFYIESGGRKRVYTKYAIHMLFSKISINDDLQDGTPTSSAPWLASPAKASFHLYRPLSWKLLKSSSKRAVALLYI